MFTKDVYYRTFFTPEFFFFAHLLRSQETEGSGGRDNLVPRALVTLIQRKGETRYSGKAFRHDMRSKTGSPRILSWRNVTSRGSDPLPIPWGQRFYFLSFSIEFEPRRPSSVEESRKKTSGTRVASHGEPLKIPFVRMQMHKSRVIIRHPCSDILTFFRLLSAILL